MMGTNEQSGLELEEFEEEVGGGGRTGRRGGGVSRGS